MSKNFLKVYQFHGIYYICFLVFKVFYINQDATNNTNITRPGLNNKEVYWLHLCGYGMAAYSTQDYMYPHLRGAAKRDLFFHGSSLRVGSLLFQSCQCIFPRVSLAPEPIAVYSWLWHHSGLPFWSVDKVSFPKERAT